MAHTGPIRLAGAEADEAEAVLADAFADYPVMRFVLGDAPGYEQRLRRLIGMFAAGRWLRGQPVLGVRDGAGVLAAVATLTPPGDHPTPPELEAITEATWRQLGDAARQRYAMMREAWSRMAGDDPPRWHLNMLGVRRSHQGCGHAAALLRAVHALAAADPVAQGVDLTTEAPANLAFYRRHGFEVVAQARVGDALTTWSLVAPKQAARGG